MTEPFNPPTADRFANFRNSLKEAADKVEGEHRRTVAVQSATSIAAAAVNGMCANPNLDGATFTPSELAGLIVAISEHLVPYLVDGTIPGSVEGEPTIGTTVG